MNRQTPSVQKAINPFLMMPATPRREQVIDSSTRKRMFGDLERLQAPDLSSALQSSNHRTIRIDAARTPMLEAGLERMRRGDALKRLRKLQEESQKVVVATQKTDQSISPIPHLRRLPKRNSSFSHAA